MPPVDDSILTDDALDEGLDLPEDFDENLDADEEMSEELDEEVEDDEESALEDDDEDTDDDLEDDDEDDEPVDRQEVERLRQFERQYQYEQEQARYRAHWQGMVDQAEAAFEWEEAQIDQRKHEYVDPDAYERMALKDLNARKVDWYRRFYASIETAKATAREKALIPVYAARVATHYELTPKQAKDLLNYPHDQMVREAKKYYLHNKQLARAKHGKQQASRKAKQVEMTGKVLNSGTGRSIRTVKPGSQAQLKNLLGFS